MTTESETLKVYEVGTVTVVGFGGQDIVEQLDLSACREEVAALVKEHSAEVLAFDLTGVQLVPSGLLGLFASIRQLGVKVQIYNPSDDIREVLAITKLDQVIEVHDVEVE